MSVNPTEPLYLFEFANREKPSINCDELEAFLNELWRKRGAHQLSPLHTSDQDRPSSSSQRFLHLLRDGSIQSRNYVGIIHYKGQAVHLLPKVFYEEDKAYTSQETQAIQAHVLWWLSYSDKLRFPKSFSGFNTLRSNFFEVLIYLFAAYTRQALAHKMYQTYQEIDREQAYMKGRLNMAAYVSQNLSTGRWHRVACTYDSFEADNLLNRIIKYVARLLLANTRNLDNKRLLQEIIFQLDEVTDTPITHADCLRVSINPLFGEFATVLNYCKLFLANSTVLSYKNALQVYAFLLPTEYLFEHFVYGFLAKHLHGAFSTIEHQKSDAYLATLFEDEVRQQAVFQLKHDIYLEREQRKMIVDCKYKLVYPHETDEGAYDPKYGVSQADLYQLSAYAIRRGVRELYLLYPSTIHAPYPPTAHQKKVCFQVQDLFSPGPAIEIHLRQIPVTQPLDHIDLTKSMEANFTHLEAQLRQCLAGIGKA